MAIRVGYLDGGGPYDGEATRAPLSTLVAGTSTALRPRGGVRYTNGLDFASSVSGSTVTTAPGSAVVSGATLWQGSYWVEVDAAVPLSIPTAHATLTRIDSVVLHVTDSAYGDATSTAAVEYLTGTASATPTAPPLTAGQSMLRLNNVRVPSSASGQGPTIDDARSWLSAAGGVVNGLATSRPGDVPKGTLVYELDTGRVVVWTGTTWRVVFDPTIPVWTALPLWNSPYFTSGTFGASYYLELSGFVNLRGRFESSAGPMGGEQTSVLTLPAGLQPDREYVFTIALSHGNNRDGGKCSVFPDGTVRCWAPNTFPATWMALDGIRYPVDH